MYHIYVFSCQKCLFIQTFSIPFKMLMLILKMMLMMMMMLMPMLAY